MFNANKRGEKLTVSQLKFHPANPNYLLSGGIDGLVNVFNTSLVEDDDALIQITNHGSSLNHAGFLSEKEIFALSHDESFSIYPFSDQDEATNNPPATIFGDLRSSLGCEYIVDVSISSTFEGTISAGYQGYVNLPHRKSVEFLQDP